MTNMMYLKKKEGKTVGGDDGPIPIYCLNIQVGDELNGGKNFFNEEYGKPVWKQG